MHNLQKKTFAIRFQTAAGDLSSGRFILNIKQRRLFHLTMYHKVVFYRKGVHYKEGVMETISAEELASRIVTKRLRIAASQGNLLPVLDYYGEINYEAVEKGYTLKHVFILRWVFESYITRETHAEVLQFANNFLREQVRLNEIYDELDKRIAEKKMLGLY